MKEMPPLPTRFHDRPRDGGAAILAAINVIKDGLACAAPAA